MKNSKFVTILGLAGMVFTVVGCSGNSSSSSTGSEEKPSSTVTEKTEIVIGSPTAQMSWVESKVNAYLKSEKLDSTYSVKMYELGESDTGNVTDWTVGPDLYAYASDQVLTLLGKGALAEVPSTYSTAMSSAMDAEAIDSAKVGTKIYGYPYAGDNGYFLYYNKSLFTDATKLETLDGIVEVAKANNLKVSYKLDDTFFSTGLMFTFGSRYNVTLSTDQKSIASVSADFNGANGLKAAKVMRSIIAENTIDTTKDAQKAPTTANGLAATVDGSWNASSYKEAMGDNYACIELPKVTVDGESKNLGSFLGYKLYGVNPSRSDTSTTKQAVAHKIANYLVSKEVQEARFDDLTIAPTNKDIKKLDKVQNTPHIKAIAAQAAYSVAQTIVPSKIWDTSTAPYAELSKAENLNCTDEKLQTVLDAYNKAIVDGK